MKISLKIKKKRTSYGEIDAVRRHLAVFAAKDVRNKDPAAGHPFEMASRILFLVEIALSARCFVDRRGTPSAYSPIRLGAFLAIASHRIRHRDFGSCFSLVRGFSSFGSGRAGLCGYGGQEGRHGRVESR